MLMASILASMMMGGFLLTVSGEVDEDASLDYDEDGGHDLYAEDQPGTSEDMDVWGDLLSDVMQDDALTGGPEAINAGIEFDEDDAEGDDYYAEDDFDSPDFAEDFAAFDVPAEADTAPEGLWTEDGSEIIIEDFIPGEDELILSIEPGEEAPRIDLFGDPAGDALVFADGHLAFRVIGADGDVIPEDVKLVEEADEDLDAAPAYA